MSAWYMSMLPAPWIWIPGINEPLDIWYKKPRASNILRVPLYLTPAAAAQQANRVGRPTSYHDEFECWRMAIHAAHD